MSCSSARNFLISICSSMLSNKGVAEPKVNPAPGETMKRQWYFPWADVFSSLAKAVENKAKGEQEIPSHKSQ